MFQIFITFVIVMKQRKSTFDSKKPKMTGKSKNMLYGIVFYLAGLKKGLIFAALS